ncbi:nuclear pore complex protein Nup214 [Anastrepha ludens]|uniref:nuclear pore complex protein Nup214 n=1 Tax=Anastrepha ludens TaxID=28586 RepID=UPI0023B15AC0|nr:nuclear pore complex protein Nup214 [Anastrepha ludens]
MAQQCPASIDVTDIQFKLQSKHKVFSENPKLRDNVNLLACSSNHGLLFVGNPNAPELQAFILSDVIYAKQKGEPVHVRTTELLNIPNIIACNADGSMLAVNYTLQGYGVLDIFYVPSFVTAEVQLLYSIRFPDPNVYALHLLWNPVLESVIGVVLSNGNFELYTLKDGGSVEMRSIKNQQIQCGCWSPKGKQIVFGHPNGKLQQFKPDLTPVKSIVCPPDLHPGPFDTIALHWLSTFQFVVSFLTRGEEVMPNMYIVNAPKGGTPAYINYNDVCYSGSEGRKQQITFLHIVPWNLLLVRSANGVEIGLLGAKDNVDQPQWVHYMLLDEARIEMPLTEASDETYPIGLVLDTSANHELTVGERKLQTMPVIHVLSTHGHLLCFNFLNLTANAVNICSPPSAIDYPYGTFGILNEGSLTKANTPQNVVEGSQNLKLPSIEPPPPAPLLNFSTQPQINATNQNTPTFGAPGNQNVFGGGFEQKPPIAKFGVPPSNNETQSNLLSKPLVQTAPTTTLQNTLKTTQNNEVFKPLYTVSPEFSPPSIQRQQQSHQATKGPTQFDSAAKSKTQQLNLNETNSVIQQMIVMQITAFEKEIRQLGQKSKLALNDDPSVMKGYSKRLINLQEIIEQANERDFIMDVQDLRHSLTESYEMLNECRTKLEMYKNPDEPGVKYLSLYDCVSQRQLKNLQGYLAINQSIMKRLEEQMDIHWSYYQDLVRRNSKSQMRVPCLDGIYQQMTKLKNLITQQQTKLHYIKSIIKQKDLAGSSRLSNELRKEAAQGMKSDIGIVSLADSILSMSIHNITDAKSNKLSESKLNALRNFTNQKGKITIIKPRRPNRVELTSEVILESKQLIKIKESKDKQIKAIKATEKVNEKMKEEKSGTSFKPMQPQSKQAFESKLQLTKTPSSVGHFVNPQSSAPTFALPKDSNLAQPIQQTGAPFSALNFTGSNLFAKNEPVNIENSPELSTFAANTNTFKIGVTENKPNAVVAPNKNLFSKSDSTSNFSFTPKGEAADATKPFNIASKGFTGFGQQPLASANPGTLFNKASNPADSSTTNQPNNAPKSFSFGGTFSTLTDTNSGSKTSATQNPPKLPTTTTTTLFGGVMTQPTIFNRQNENQTIAAPQLSSANPPSLEKSSPDATQTKSGEAVALTKNVATSDQIAAASSDATQIQSNADDMLLKSLNICKPTAKEAVKPKEGNIFAFNSNTENMPQSAFQPMFDTSTSSPLVKVNTTTTATTASSTPSIFGRSGAIAESSFSPFSGIGTNISTFGSVTSSGFTSNTTPTVSTPATSTVGSTGASAFSFSNSAAFKQLPTFQNQTSSITSTTSATLSVGTPTPPVSTSAAVNTTPVATALTVTQTTTPVTVAASTTLTPTAAATTPITTIVATTPSSIAVATTPTATVATAAKSTTIAQSTDGSTVPASASTSPFFSAFVAAKAPGDSLFSKLEQQTQVASPVNLVAKTENTTQPAATNLSLFGGMSLGSQPSESGGSIFGNASSGFGATGGGIFGGAATATIPISPQGITSGNTSTGSIFGNSAAKSGDTTSTSIFGGNNATKPTENTTGSIFGNAAAKSAENTSGSIFGGGAAKSPENVNVFGSPTSAGTAVSSGSIFGQSALGQSTGSIFASAANKPDSTSTASGFSFVGSAFGNATKNNSASGGSLFGGAAASPDSQQQQQSNIFGSPTGGFGATATSPFSSFSQGGTAVASPSFGSPTQQPQTGAFSRPVFGGAPTFGSPPVFGAQSTFGAAPSFGSPKGFGTFATPTTTSFGAPTTQSSNIFEALGSTDTGLSFGNLAQTTKTPANAPKPMFGGSSFMNYRA